MFGSNSCIIYLIYPINLLNLSFYHNQYNLAIQFSLLLNKLHITYVKKFNTRLNLDFLTPHCHQSDTDRHLGVSVTLNTSRLISRLFNAWNSIEDKNRLNPSVEQKKLMYIENIRTHFTHFKSQYLENLKPCFSFFFCAILLCTQHQYRCPFFSNFFKTRLRKGPQKEGGKKIPFHWLLTLTESY